MNEHPLTIHDPLEMGSTCQGSNFGDSPDLAQQCANESIRDSFFLECLMFIRYEWQTKFIKDVFHVFLCRTLANNPPPGTTVIFIFCVRFCQWFPTGNAGWWSSARTTIVHNIFMLFHVHECSWYMCLRTYKTWFACEILCTFTMRQWVIWINMCIIYIYVYTYT